VASFQHVWSGSQIGWNMHTRFRASLSGGDAAVLSHPWISRLGELLSGFNASTLKLRTATTPKICVGPNQDALAEPTAEFQPIRSNTTPNTRIVSPHIGILDSHVPSASGRQPYLSLAGPSYKIIDRNVCRWTPALPPSHHTPTTPSRNLTQVAR
jgi:hypothetical protein